jgi:hypothetical protein
MLAYMALELGELHKLGGPTWSSGVIQARLTEVAWCDNRVS